MTEQLIKILQVAPEKRNSNAVNYIVKMTKGFSFFQSLNKQNESAHYYCCKQMRIQEFEGNQEVVKFGDYGDTFYIILKGEVSVHVPISPQYHANKIKSFQQVVTQLQKLKQIENQGSNQESNKRKSPTQQETTISKKQQNNISNQLKQNSSLILTFLPPKIKKEDLTVLSIEKLIQNLKNPRDTIQYREVAILKEGTAFGEQAILNNDVRAATIITKTQCCFAVLDKQTYENAIKIFDTQKFKEIIEFFGSLEFFQN